MGMSKFKVGDKVKYCPRELGTPALSISSVYTIERVENNKGYTLENVVPCCEQCNYMKLDYDALNFIQHCDKIVKHRYKLP
jgi:hypothetical protein